MSPLQPAVEKLFPFQGTLNLLLVVSAGVLMLFLGTDELTADLANWYAGLGMIALCLLVFSFLYFRVEIPLRNPPPALFMYIFLGVGGGALFSYIMTFYFPLASDPTANWLIMFILVIIEEATFRFAFPRFLAITFQLPNTQMAWLVCVLVSNLVFGVFHAVAYSLSLEKMLLATLAGMIQSFAYRVATLTIDHRGEYALAGLSLGHFWHNWALVDPHEALLLTMLLSMAIIVFALLNQQRRLHIG